MEGQDPRKRDGTGAKGGEGRLAHFRNLRVAGPGSLSRSLGPHHCFLLTEKPEWPLVDRG